MADSERQWWQTKRVDGTTAWSMSLPMPCGDAVHRVAVTGTARDNPTSLSIHPCAAHGDDAHALDAVAAAFGDPMPPACWTAARLIVQHASRVASVAPLAGEDEIRAVVTAAALMCVWNPNPWDQSWQATSRMWSAALNRAVDVPTPVEFWRAHPHWDHLANDLTALVTGRVPLPYHPVPNYNEWARRWESAGGIGEWSARWWRDRGYTPARALRLWSQLVGGNDAITGGTDVPLTLLAG